MKQYFSGIEMCMALLSDFLVSNGGLLVLLEVHMHLAICLKILQLLSAIII
jgi:hypothetical protein